MARTKTLYTQAQLKALIAALEARAATPKRLCQMAPLLNSHPHDFPITFKVTAAQLMQLYDWTGDGNRSQVIRDRLFTRDQTVSKLYPVLVSLSRQIATLKTPENREQIEALLTEIQTLAAQLRTGT